MKYRICKVQDANNTIRYKVQYKKWWYWKNVKIYHQSYVGHGYYETISFFTFDQAKEWVDRTLANYNWIKKSKQQKIVECVEV